MEERVISIEIPDEKYKVNILRSESDKKRKNVLRINSYYHLLVAIVCIVVIVLLVQETIKEIKYLDYILDHPEEDFLGLGRAFTPFVIILLLEASLAAFVFGPAFFIMIIITSLKEKSEDVSHLAWMKLLLILIGSTFLLAGGIYALGYDLTYEEPSMLRDFKILFVGITGTSVVLAILSVVHMIRIKRSLRREMMIINSRSIGEPLDL